MNTYKLKELHHEFNKIHQQIAQIPNKTESDQYRNRAFGSLISLIEIYTTISNLKDQPLTYIFSIEARDNDTMKDTIDIYESTLLLIELPTLHEQIQNKEYHKINDTLDDIYQTITDYQKDIRRIENIQHYNKIIV